MRSEGSHLQEIAILRHFTDTIKSIIIHIFLLYNKNDRKTLISCIVYAIFKYLLSMVAILTKRIQICEQLFGDLPQSASRLKSVEKKKKPACWLVSSICRRRTYLGFPGRDPEKPQHPKNSPQGCFLHGRCSYLPRGADFFIVGVSLCGNLTLLVFLIPLFRNSY